MKCRSRRSIFRRSDSGFSLLEVMVVLVVLSIVGVGVSVGMQTAVATPEVTDRALAISTELTSEMENWRAVSFGGAPWPSTLPYSVSNNIQLKVGGQRIVYGRTTSIAQWDPNNLASNASPQADFVRIQITINGQSMILFLTKPV